MTTGTITELMGSRSLQVQVGKRSATQKLLAYHENGDYDYSMSAVRRDLETLGYIIGFKYPEDGSLSLVSIDIQPQDERAKTWEVDLSYETGEPGDGGEFEIGPVSQNVTTKVELIDVWRVNPNPEATPVGDDVSGDDPSGDASAGEDVGGNSADTAGKPLSYPLPLIDLVLVENTTNSPDFIRLAGLIGCRNDDMWGGGAPRGTVIYRGSSSNYGRNGLYQVTHNFTADLTFKHMRQMAVADPATGAPKVAQENTANNNSSANAAAFDEDGEPPAGSGTTTEGAAEKVVWVQRFPNFCDFTTIYEFNPFADDGGGGDS